MSASLGSTRKPVRALDVYNSRSLSFDVVVVVAPVALSCVFHCGTGFPSPSRPIPKWDSHPIGSRGRPCKNRFLSFCFVVVAPVALSCVDMRCCMHAVKQRRTAINRTITWSESLAHKYIHADLHHLRVTVTLRFTVRLSCLFSLLLLLFSVFSRKQVMRSMMPCRPCKSRHTTALTWNELRSLIQPKHGRLNPPPPLFFLQLFSSLRSE